MLRCSNCGYFWHEVGDKYPRCHFPSDDPFPAPCEEDDWYPEEIEEDDDYEQVLSLLPRRAGNYKRCSLL